MVVPPSSVELRICENGKPVTVARIRANSRNRDELQYQALRWQYIVRQRNRWSTSDQGRRAIKTQALATLKKIGIGRTHLARLGKTTTRSGVGLSTSRLIEVSIPWRSERHDEWARIMPWEYLLSVGSQDYQSQKKIVVRSLNLAKPITRMTEPTTYATLLPSPDLLRKQTTIVGSERSTNSILAPLEFLDLHRDCGARPELSRVARWLKKHQPSILHVAGVSPHQVPDMLEEDQDLPPDGIVFGNHVENRLIDGREFAESLFGRSYRPYLVAFQVWHSGSRLAPLVVARGAHAAVGFESTFDDSVVELFLIQFYHRWMEEHWNGAQAFYEAIDATSPYSERLRGSGIMLWTRASMLEVQKVDFNVGPRTSKRRQGLGQAKTIGVVADPQRDNGSMFIAIQAQPYAQLNYAHLHNGGSLLESLSLELLPYSRIETSTEHDPLDGPERTTTYARSEPIVEVRDLDVVVSLSTGAESFPFRSRVTLTESERVVDLARVALEATEHHPAGGVFVPLTSELMRNLDESILTNLHVEVGWHDQVLFNRSYPVRLAPADEWRFEEDQIIWMSSFVQPRDEAISRIIESSQRYLATLADDTSAGFGGYQAYDPESRDPWRGVDQQVQAIWMALVLDYRLGYINPPPSYSENAQRLRTPDRILQEKRGTCVDLALLMAACLEWIEIYPVLFNLNDHAFPGYWRDPDAYERFQGEPTFVPSEDPETLRNWTSRSEAPPPWYSPSGVYAELRSFVLPDRKSTETDEHYHARCQLIPLETTFLTRSLGFHTAIDEARTYFIQPKSRDFHSMIDVTRSRRCVTPLPRRRVSC